MVNRLLDVALTVAAFWSPTWGETLKTKLRISFDYLAAIFERGTYIPIWEIGENLGSAMSHLIVNR